MRRKPIRTIRPLHPDEPVPDGEPERRRDRDGYIKLRWQIDDRTVVEEYEHRIVAGRPHRRMDVRHINGDRLDNRPENLSVEPATRPDTTRRRPDPKPGKTSRPARRDTGPTRLQRNAVHRRSGGRCEVCALDLTSGGGQIHHRKPRGMGGTKDPAINSPANLIHVCPDCHRAIEANRTHAYQAGLLVRATHDPAATPVVTIHGVVTFDDVGGWERT